MKQIIFPVIISALLMTACGDNQPKSGYDLAKYNARHYVFSDLGDDSADFEEVSWGQVERRKVNYADSRAYKTYTDSMNLLNVRLKELDDSTNMEFTLRGDSPEYKTLKMRRDAFDREVQLYMNRQSDLEMRYNVDPEYDGYWIYHEYKINGEPRNVYILLGDTMNYRAIEMIYK